MFRVPAGDSNPGPSDCYNKTALLYSLYPLFLMYFSLCFQAQGATHEILARAIFDELNEAYTKFEESGAKPLF